MAAARGEDGLVFLRQTSKSQGNRFCGGSSSQTERKRRVIVTGARTLATLRRRWLGFTAAGERKPATGMATITGRALHHKTGLHATEVRVGVA